MASGGSLQMSIDREKILKQLARVMNQVAEGDETFSSLKIRAHLAYWGDHGGFGYLGCTSRA
jgi:hypothetical protein